MPTKDQQKPDKSSATAVTKSDGKPSKYNNSGVLSPKPTRKGDRENRFERSPERLETDELSSRLTLIEIFDSFFSDSTFKRFESYFFSVDGILGWLRDGEKSVAAVTTVKPAVEKKIGKLKMPSSATPQTALLSTLTNETSSTNIAQGIDEQFSLTEINCSSSEMSVYKQLTELIPVASKTDEKKNTSDLIPPPYVEQIISMPTDRTDVMKHPRFFSLLPPSSSAEGEEEILVVDSSTTNQLRQESKVKTKSMIKEEMKIDEDETEKELPSKYRWIIPPKERKEISIRFVSNEVGKFEQNFAFEIMGAKGKYILKCVGLCQHAQIATDVKKIFPKSRKLKEEKTIVHGEYIIGSNLFEFGPLLHGKPREKYLERFPENHALFNFSNSSNIELKISFGLRHDIKGETFFFEPQSMDLAPGQSIPLNIWAYPRSPIHYEDMLICCVKDNPEPYCYKISCIGVKPEIEIDKKNLSFDKLLLGRIEQRELRLKNNTMIGISWKLVGIDSLGEEFVVEPLEGILEPYQEGTVVAHFKASKPTVVKRSIRLEVFDTDKVGGIVQEIPIWITAEAYDIAMDLHFPKGYDGLDFGVLKVGEEGRQTCTLKNKGKYEVGYRFTFEMKSLTELFRFHRNKE